MVYYSEILRRFDFKSSDLDNVLTVKYEMLAHEDSFIKDIIEYLSANEKLVDKYGTNLQGIKIDKLRLWYSNFVIGKISSALGDFVREYEVDTDGNGLLDGQDVFQLLSFIRIWFQNTLFEVADCEWEYKNILNAYTKILNAVLFVSLNTFTGKNKDTMKVSKIKSTVLSLAEKVSIFTHSILLLFLIVMTFAGIIFFVWSVYDMRDIAPDKIFVTALGSLLVLWVLIELINSEIQMLRGDKFRISIFIGVVLIAFIREVLIMTLKHDVSNMNAMLLMLGGVLVFGITYWLLAKSEQRER